MEAPSQGGQLFAKLADLADQVIYGSLDWTDALHHPLATASCAVGDRARQAVSDLAWRRLKLWRRLMAQALDPAVAPLRGVREIEVEHGHHAMTQAWLPTAWLALRLGRRPMQGATTGETGSRWPFKAPYGMVAVTIPRLGSGEAEIPTFRVAAAPPGRDSRHPPLQGRPGTAGRDLRCRTRDGHRPERPPTGPGPALSPAVPRPGTRDALFRDCMAVARSMARAVPPGSDLLLAPPPH